MNIIAISNHIGASRSSGGAETAFVFTVQTDNAGTSAANQFTIPITSATPYDIQTSDGQSITGATGATTLTFPSAGTYTVSITDSCEGWRFNNVGDKLKLLNISSWGVYKNTASNSFFGAQNMTCSAVDAPINAPTTMQGFFRDCQNFNGAIGNWDVSNVVDFAYCFYQCYAFTQDLDNWDTSSAVSFLSMFENAINFNGNVSTWNTSNATNMRTMFIMWLGGPRPFNQNLNSWDTSNVTTMHGMFRNCINYNQPLDNFNTSNVIDMFVMFGYCSIFNQPIGNWAVSNVANMSQMFVSAVSFNQPLNTWNTSSVSNMADMFKLASSFNQPLNTWNTITVTNMTWMFGGATSFNQDLSTWNTSNVTSLSNTFESTTASSFGIANWDTSSVNNFNATFRFNTSFNEDISGWNVTGCTSNFNDTFSGCQSFNQPIGNWNITSSVTRLSNLLSNAVSFDQDLSSWNISSVTVFNSFASNVTLSTANYGALLVAWESQAPVYSGSINFGVSQYFLGSAAETARTSLINTYGWTITDGGGIVAPVVPFTITVDTTLGDGLAQFTIPTRDPGYNYDVATSDGQSITGNTGNTTITFPVAGIYDIEITGDFPWIYFNSSGDRLKLTDIKKWGSIAWANFDRAFYGCTSLNNVTATDAPDLSLVTDMYRAFRDCNFLTMNFSTWDTGNVIFFVETFFGTQGTAWHSQIVNWDVSSVTTTFRMFTNTTFNEDLSNWDVSSVTSFGQMFSGTTVIDQSFAAWNIGQATLIPDAFFNFLPATLSTINYDATLISWAGQAPTSNVRATFGGSQYTLGGAAEAARNTLINTYGWTITDGGGWAPLTTNLVASYNFDADFTDYTGNHPLTADGNVTAGAAGGVVSNCSDFGGTSSDFLTALDSDDFSFTDGVSDLPFSVSMWVNFDVVGNSWFFDKRGTSPNDEYQINYYSGSFAIALGSQGGFAAYLNATYAITPVVGTWYHLTWTYDGSGTFAGIKLYIDGVSQALTDISVGTYVGMSNGTGMPRFGKFTDSGWFNGKMDEAHIWKDRELTAAEVTDVYTTELAGNSILP